jgi:hypothetical protein
MPQGRDGLSATVSICLRTKLSLWREEAKEADTLRPKTLGMGMRRGPAVTPCFRLRMKAGRVETGLMGVWVEKAEEANAIGRAGRYGLRAVPSLTLPTPQGG